MALSGQCSEMTSAARNNASSSGRLLLERVPITHMSSASAAFASLLPACNPYSRFRKTAQGRGIVVKIGNIDFDPQP